MSEHRYTVLGMACDHCAAAVTEALEHLPGVTAIAVDVDTDSVTLTSTLGLDPADVRTAVEAAGYELAST
ncbi:heavy-metal-associated domain-containing protein [Nocardia cyriacigeorgica]|uniref:heavy-metal-associated domain-containing protein n=1 Tax=Nocardia cyriacigeorgica TaxID=135487 RepID=UPI00189611B3|nr:heavy-metal-associated domain-containing protein [Nocardia cyriacigeorgica]MBF6097702.1 heavy-metal-associated domain-containing protein [Nocardia cyriacigeorgica]MBF6161655.1 heavy-metal-associated domain-containing protein [Nocardia cyriacigeorgica]MBF6200453.1 heavy-metal-associated domain-containing protein [Nocardia cyriacigeorgica]MBF6342083.1 heavy-metal-associated domain-containing protein [Nocardia cyriacigeorgica]MBF6512953.1 heavy-metal-associated domain-containing protein [Nocar